MGDAKRMMRGIEEVRANPARIVSLLEGRAAEADDGYKTLTIPLATLGILPSIAAGAAMAFSSVSAVTNSLRLNRFGRRTSAVPA